MARHPNVPTAASPEAGIALPRLLLILGGVLGLIVLLLGIAAAVVIPNLPSLDNLTDYQPKQPLRVYTADEQLIGEFGAERRHYLPLEQIPKRMQNALLAVEDSNFYEHGGLYYPGILRAALANLFSSRSQGGSTITQQLARDLYLTKKKLYSRKFVEVLLALKIESQLSKEKILEVYMNQIYLGQKAYGFEAAAEAYFGKSLKDLSIAESAMLAGLPQNPAYANPIANFQRAKRRQLIVLERMRDTGVITPEDHDAAKAERLHIRSAQDQRLHAEYAAEMARQVVYAQYGEEAYTRGFKVYTTLLAEQQQAAYKALRRTLLEYERRKPYRGPEAFVDLPDDAADEDAAIAQALGEHPDNDDLRAAVVTKVSSGKLLASLQNGDELTITGDGLRGVQSALSDKARPELKLRRGAIIRVMRGAPSKDQPQGAWVVVQAPEAEGALVAVAPDSGRVQALVGGFDFARNKVNHVTQAWRQPGSSFKPFVYSAALELGVTPGTLVNDAPIVYDNWEPKNYDGTFDGPMTVKTALARSKNMVTIRVLEQLSPARAKAWAGRFGLDQDKQPDNLTLALGSGSVTPLQMASAYSVFANGGYALKPLVIARITDAKGAVLFEADPPKLGEEQRAISERNAFVIDSLLQEVALRGTAARASAALKRYDLYGKTGTTNDAVDAWFAGFHKTLTAVVWIGYDSPRSLGERETGGGAAMPAWIDFMAVALRNAPPAEIGPPSEGLLRQADGDWVFEEFAGDAGIRSIGLAPAPADAAASAPAP
ncbi:PBP1A family penicillin-binding protein [Paucibacter sp. APW11]|uniref:Penicillin-binding protein 1A n=1 Tax=Roseateles aquae TaxID=3077235 RepID=A0ABU3PAW5_9BURK|nr:PBP1A family penicillin-binding protein [Paucibacter sp. APW11]MDT8998891.1 PBP1A family penicillin-binding protein [Paucibacter sp. APW11]